MDKHKTFLTTEINFEDIYKLMVSSIIPRPIAWVSSISKCGIKNLAPFSFFTVASRNPPTLAFSIGPDERDKINGKKDTLKNIEETKEYVIHIPNQSLVQQVLGSSYPFLEAENEIEKVNLKSTQGVKVGVPIISDAPISFELQLKEVIKIGTDHLILGEIKAIHVNKELYLGNYKIDSKKLNPLSSVINQFAGMTDIYMPKVTNEK